MKAYIDVRWIDSYGGLEFPPSPTRFIQSIIAATVDSHIDLLKNLELTIPVIYATKSPSVLEFSKFVPNNDERFPHINASSQRAYIVRRCENGLRAVYEYDIEEKLYPELKAAVSAIHTLGRSGDFVVARTSTVRHVDGLDSYELNENGTVRLFTPVPGFVDSVFARYNNGAPLRLQHSYFAKNLQSRRANAFFSLTDPVPNEDASLLVSWIRHAASPLLPDISGHGEHNKRLVIVPITTLDYADNMIRRVMISSPDNLSVRSAETKMAALHLTSEDGKDRGYLVPADCDAVFSDYLAASRIWRCVTPIVGAYDNGDQRQRMRNMMRLFEYAGLPLPKKVTFLPKNSKHFVNVRHREFPRFFIEAEFAEAIPGPVLLGRGRFTGLGILSSKSE